ncbi:MAG: hypothetical protein Q9191_000428 [Dirinaria sp. TL-2023a]
MSSFRVDKLDDLLFKQGVRSYPYDKSFEQAASDPIAIVHTSGSTGMPKPIVWNHGMYAAIDAQSIPSSLAGRRNVYCTMKECERHTMPISHSSGLVRFLRAIFLGVVLVVGPPNRLIGPDPASLECINQVLEYASVDAANFLPSTLETLCKSPQSLKRLSKLRFIGFGGGNPPFLGKIVATVNVPLAPLAKEAGDTISAWRQAREDLYEMVVVKDPKLEKFQCAFKSHPELQEWSTRDLYSKHPSKPYHWRHEARMDDLIVSANGAKFNPLNLQERVEQHVAVRFALVAGNHRLRPALIVQLRDPCASEAELAALCAEIWSVVSQVNESIPSQGRVMESLIMFTKPEKPFPLAAKGSVRRKFAEAMYHEELDALYKAAGPEAGYGF